MQAFRLLNDPQHAGQLNAEQFLDLAVKAGFSEEAAQKAASERALARMREGLPA